MMGMASVNWSHVKWEGQKRGPSQAMYAADTSSSNGACRAVNSVQAEVSIGWMHKGLLSEWCLTFSICTMPKRAVR